MANNAKNDICIFNLYLLIKKGKVRTWNMQIDLLIYNTFIVFEPLTSHQNYSTFICLEPPLGQAISCKSNFRILTQVNYNTWYYVPWFVFVFFLCHLNERVTSQWTLVSVGRPVTISWAWEWHFHAPIKALVIYLPIFTIPNAF